MALIWRHRAVQDRVRRQAHCGLLLLFMALAWIMPVLPVYGQHTAVSPAFEEAEEITTQNDPSLSDSVRRIHQETGGNILGVERVSIQGNSINRVKYLDEHGRVRYMDDVEKAETP